MKSSGQQCVELFYREYIAIYWTIGMQEFQLLVLLASDCDMPTREVSGQLLSLRVTHSRKYDCAMADNRVKSFKLEATGCPLYVCVVEC